MSNTLEALPRPRFTADAFYRMGDAGVFEGRNVMLVEGELVEMSAEGARHFKVIDNVLEALKPVYPEGLLVRRPGPLQLSLHTDPEPDIAVVRGRREDFDTEHPSHAELVVEVSDSTIRYDRTFKVDLYASAGIPEYWIVALTEGLVEVYRNPVRNQAGATYTTKTRHKPGETLQPPFATATVAVADLLR